MSSATHGTSGVMITLTLKGAGMKREELLKELARVIGAPTIAGPGEPKWTVRNSVRYFLADDRSETDDESEQAERMTDAAMLAAASEALSYLCAVIPGLADVVEGTAVIVPKEPTDAMFLAAIKEQNSSAVLNYGKAPSLEDYWEVMLDASPYRAKSNDDA